MHTHLFPSPPFLVPPPPPLSLYLCSPSTGKPCRTTLPRGRRTSARKRRRHSWMSWYGLRVKTVVKTVAKTVVKTVVKKKALMDELVWFTCMYVTSSYTYVTSSYAYVTSSYTWMSWYGLRVCMSHHHTHMSHHHTHMSHHHTHG
jgi:hypothetical protein